MARETIEFIKAAIRDPIGVSTVFPTSKYLADTLLDHANITPTSTIVELGSGTGAITKRLALRLTEQNSYTGVELDPKMVEFLKSEFKALRFEAGLAEDILKWAQPESVDAVVSSLPWTVFNEALQLRTITALHKALKPGGIFVTYVCVNALLYPSAKSFIGSLNRVFSEVKRSPLEWRNIPPAFVFQARK